MNGVDVGYAGTVDDMGGGIDVGYAGTVGYDEVPYDG